MQVTVIRCVAEPNFSPETLADGVSALIRRNLVQSDLIEKFEVEADEERDGKGRPWATVRVWYNEEVHQAAARVKELLRPLFAATHFTPTPVLTLDRIEAQPGAPIAGEIHTDLNIEVPPAIEAKPLPPDAGGDIIETGAGGIASVQAEARGIEARRRRRADQSAPEPPASE